MATNYKTLSPTTTDPPSLITHSTKNISIQLGNRVISNAKNATTKLVPTHHIAVLRAKVPGVGTETRWCPSQQGIEWNEVANEWAKLVADDPDAHGVEWFNFHGPERPSQEEKAPSRGPWPIPSAGFGEEAR